MLDKLPALLLILIALPASAANVTFQNYYSKRIISRKDGIYFYNAAVSFFALIFIVMFSGFELFFSAATVLYGCVFGVFILINTVSVSKAMSIGPMGYTSLIINFSTVITAISGLVIWNESVSPYKYIGLFFVMICFFLSTNTETNNKSASVKWMILSALGMFSCVFIGLTQKVFLFNNSSDYLPTFLAVSFLFSTFSSLILSLSVERKEEKKLFKVIFGDKRSTKLTLCVLICAGLCTALVHVINLRLVGILPTIMAFPIINGGSLLLTLLSSFVIFHEKLTKKQTIGMMVGIVAFAFLCF